MNLHRLDPRQPRDFGPWSDLAEDNLAAHAWEGMTFHGLRFEECGPGKYHGYRFRVESPQFRDGRDSFEFGNSWRVVVRTTRPAFTKMRFTTRLP